MSLTMSGEEPSIIHDCFVSNYHDASSDIYVNEAKQLEIIYVNSKE